MENLKELEVKLGGHFKINSCRLKFITAFISILYLVRTVNFTHIAKLMPGSALISSQYRKIQRFFENHDFDLDIVARFMVANIPNCNEKFYLTLDRTNWKFGTFNINILVLWIACKGISFPILWILLDRKGNSNTSERIQIIEKFILLFGKEKIKFFDLWQRIYWKRMVQLSNW